MFACYRVTRNYQVPMFAFLTCSIEIDVLSSTAESMALQPVESWEISSFWKLAAPFNLSTSWLIEFNCSFSIEIIVVAVVGVRDAGDENEIWTLFRRSWDNVGGKSLSKLVSMNFKSSSLVFERNFLGFWEIFRLFLDRIDEFSAMLSLLASIWIDCRLIGFVGPFGNLFFW